MKIIAILLIFVFLTGCGSGNETMDRSMSIRSRLQGSGCEFLASITADYQQQVVTFQMKCRADTDGNLEFTVISPESISGITGEISDEGGKLTFDEQVLLFSVLAEDLLSPVSAPWVFVKALRSGYISGAGQADGGIRLEVDDTYAENALKLIVITDNHDIPVSAEIFWQGYRIVEMCVENFVYL